MSDPQTPAGPESPNAQVDGPVELAEFRAVANLLRQLPEPEPPEDLHMRVMERVRAEQERPGVVRSLFGSPKPGIAAALAAGIAGWMFLVSPQGTLPGTSSANLVPNPSKGKAAPAPASDIALPVRRASAPRFGSAAIASQAPQAFFASDDMRVSTQAAPRTLPPLHRRLDRQIDQMLHEPDAFFLRLERIRENDRYLARLAERSARRGDSAAVALKVRATEHPLAPRIAEQFLRASLAHSANGAHSAVPPSPPKPSRPATSPAGETGVIYSH